MTDRDRGTFIHRWLGVAPRAAPARVGRASSGALASRCASRPIAGAHRSPPLCFSMSRRTSRDRTPTIDRRHDGRTDTVMTDRDRGRFIHRWLGVAPRAAPARVGRASSGALASRCASRPIAGAHRSPPLCFSMSRRTSRDRTPTIDRRHDGRTDTVMTDRDRGRFIHRWLGVPPPARSPRGTLGAANVTRMPITRAIVLRCAQLREGPGARRIELLRARSLRAAHRDRAGARRSPSRRSNPEKCVATSRKHWGTIDRRHDGRQDTVMTDRDRGTFAHRWLGVAPPARSPRGSQRAGLAIVQRCA